MKKFKSLKIRGNFGQRDYVYNLKDHVRMCMYYLSSYWKNFESSSDDETEDWSSMDPTERMSTEESDEK